jgi:multidrug efflux system membrane fusion protein
MSLKIRRPSVASFVTLTLALLLAGCGKSPNAADAGSGKSGAKGGKGGKGGGPAPVVVAQVTKQKVPLVIDAIGSVEPIKMTSVRSQVPGTLQKIAIKEGQDVKEGDLLFEIDPRPFRNALQTAEADLAKIRVQLETAKAQVGRYRTVSSEQMISKEQFQRIEDEARTLEAELVASQSRVSTAKVQLEYCSIRAPIAGRTGNISVHEGDVIRGSDSGALVTINQLNPIYVSFGVPQQFLGAINRYRAERALPVKVAPPGADDQHEMGELTFVDNMVDSTTGTIRLKATFANAQQRLWPGQFATVTVTLAEPEVLTVASAAVQSSQTGQHVFVVSADRLAELRPIVVERNHEGLAVVTKGLKEGESVVIDGQLRVVPGRSVEIKQPVPPVGTKAKSDTQSEDGGGKKKGGKQPKAATKDPVAGS